MSNESLRRFLGIPITKNLCRDSLIILALLVDYTCAYMIAFIWKLELYYFAIVPVTSFIVGVLVVDLKKCIAYTCSSLVASGVLTVGMIVAPAVIQGESLMINIGAFMGANFVSKLLIISIILCVFGALLGGLLGEAWE